SGVLDRDYPDTGLVLCNLQGARAEPSLVATGAGGAIGAWTDARTGLDIFALQVAPAARTTGVPATTPGGPAFTYSGPNPARASLTLRYTLPSATNTRVSIYDLNGRRLRELFSGPGSIGEHQITWDLRDERGQPTRGGVYFARLQTEGHTVTQHFIRIE